MTTSKTRRLANLITNTGDVKTASLDNASGGATSYDSAGVLPTSGNTAGDLAFTTDKKALYNWDGSEWDRVYSGPNETITWDTALGATTGLVLDGSQQVIQVAAAADKEGFPIEYNYELSPTAPQQLDSSFTIIDSANGRFTIKPTTNTNRAGTFQFRATATDGTHVISSTTTATLAFRFIAAGVEASSQTITVNGTETWRYHLFDSSSSFTVTQDIDSAEYILIGGGGDGGTNGGGGGGAGGFLKGSTALVAGTYTYTIGRAGDRATPNNSNTGSTWSSRWSGHDTTLTGTGVNLTATGGGGGGLRTGTTPYTEARGAAGGSSGGNGGGNGTSSNPIAGVAGQGNAGGDDGSTDTNAGAGGGGGAGGAGGNGGYRSGGNGGAGIQDNFTGTLTYYSAGGSGGVVVNGTGGSPGTGHDSAGYGMGGDGTGGNTEQKATQGVLMIRYKLAG